MKYIEDQNYFWHRRGVLIEEVPSEIQSNPFTITSFVVLAL